ELHLKIRQVGAHSRYVCAVLSKRVTRGAKSDGHLLQLIRAAGELRRDACQGLKAEDTDDGDAGAHLTERSGRVVGEPGSLVGRAACVVDAFLEIGSRASCVAQGP